MMPPPLHEGDWRERAEARLRQQCAQQPLPLPTTAAEVHELRLQQVILDLHQEDAAQALAETALKAKNADLAILSHEIRTPMNGILGLTELLLMTPLTEEQADLARTVHQAAESLLTLVNDLLDAAKLDDGKLILEAIAFDPRTAVSDAVRLLRPRLADAPVQLLVHFAPALPTLVLGDPGRWRQIVVNLLGNAVKFTAHGRIVVELDWDQAGLESASLVLRVDDTGVGIPSRHLSHLFTPFVQAESSTSRRFGGSGLGLAITQDLCRLMGGSISVSSVEGQGSTFTVRLPLAVEAPPRVPLREALSAYSPFAYSPIAYSSFAYSPIALARKVVVKKTPTPQCEASTAYGEAATALAMMPAMSVWCQVSR
jgi:signal transduction histidine kinase